MSAAPPAPPSPGAPIFRVGTKLGRSIYANDKFIGIMDDVEWAQIVVDVLNEIMTGADDG